MEDATGTINHNIFNIGDGVADESYGLLCIVFNKIDKTMGSSQSFSKASTGNNGPKTPFFLWWFLIGP